VPQQTVIREVREVPVLYEADVVVAGGGSAGVTAAVGACRIGARTILLERNFCLGGMMTAGLMSVVGLGRLNCGLAQEIMRTLVDMGPGARQEVEGDVPPSRRHGGGLIDPEETKWLLDNMMMKEGVQVLLGSPVVGVAMDGHTIEAAITENKSGRLAIGGKIFVDATGDGDLAYHAGARYEVGRPEDGLCSASTLMFMVSNVDVGKVVAHFDQNPGDYGSVFDGRDTSRRSWGRVKDAFCAESVKPAMFAFSDALVSRILASERLSDWDVTLRTQRPMC
jgi:flavin-dependent dehydrogenase